MIYSASWLYDVLKAAGLKVVEVPGWKSRGRGDLGTIKGIMCHHTACAHSAKGNTPSMGIVEHGRPDLAGPLAQLLLGRDGTYFTVAAGRCNHAGRGVWQGFTMGNTNFLGLEAENDGLPDEAPWPAVQMDAYVKGVAAILKHINAKPIMAVGHKEYALPHGRKSDPDFDMSDFRKKVEQEMSK